MYFFLKEIILTVLITLFVGEIICRVLPIVPDIPVRTNKKGYYMLKENQEGNYIRGKFPKWLEATYSVNNLGFVSSRDYFFNEKNENKIAIIGDSFVESFQVNENKSIGRLIEGLIPGVTVYEFGFSGYNFFDYKDFYSFYNLKTFNQVFIIVDKNDVFDKGLSKVTFTDAINLKEKIFRGIYNNLYFFKYLNWNHGFVREVMKIPYKLCSLNFKLKKNLSDPEPQPITPFVLKNQNIKLVLKSKKDSVLKNYYPNLEFISIDQKFKPYDFGFDKHWNENGRKNVANTLIKWINL